MGLLVLNTRPIAKISWLIVALCATTTWARSQEVTLAELQGAVIDFSSIYQEKIIRDGAVRFPQLHNSGRIEIGAGNTLSIHSQVSSAGKARTNSGTFVIGKPGKDGEGDDVVWVFSGGTLRRLTVYGGAGGQMVVIAFRRGPRGLSCSYSKPLARETGVGKILKGSSVDGVPIQILEFKHVSSSCRVAKG